MFTTGTCNRPLQCIFSSNRTSGFQSAERNPILLLEAFPWPLCYLALRHWFSNCSVVLKLFRSQRSLKTASKFWWGQGWNAIVPQWYHSDHGAMDTQEHFNIYGGMCILLKAHSPFFKLSSRAMGSSVPPESTSSFRSFKVQQKTGSDLQVHIGAHCCKEKAHWGCCQPLGASWRLHSPSDVLKCSLVPIAPWLLQCPLGAHFWVIYGESNSFYVSIVGCKLDLDWHYLQPCILEFWYI